MAPGPSDFPTFTQVARALPGLRPRVAQAALRALHAQAQQDGQAMLGGHVLAAHELAGLFVATVRDGFAARAVSPTGAALLVRLYRAGALDTGGQPPGTPAPQLLAYARGDAPWDDAAGQRADRRAAYDALLAQPAAVREADFTARLLDDLFRRHRGRGEGELEVGGLRVRRRLSKQVAGRGLAFAVHFEWVDAAGEVRRLSAASAHAGIWTRPDPGSAA